MRTEELMNMDRRTSITKLRVAFRNFENGLKKARTKLTTTRQLIPVLN